MKKTIVIATKNKGKINDFKHFLGAQYDVLSLYDVATELVTVEDADSFEGNAYKKAKELFDVLGVTVVADDSGLSVDYLDGRPGIYSARYAGDHDDDANNAKLLTELAGVPKEQRTAKLITCLVCLTSDGQTHVVHGEMLGTILDKERGTNGFAYAKLFEVKGTELSYAEMTNEERSKHSHRNKALTQLVTLLEGA